MTKEREKEFDKRILGFGFLSNLFFGKKIFVFRFSLEQRTKNKTQKKKKKNAFYVVVLLLV